MGYLKEKMNASNESPTICFNALLPPVFDTLLSSEEIADLVAYLKKAK